MKIAGYSIRHAFENIYFRDLEDAKQFCFDYCLESYEDYEEEYKKMIETIQPITWAELWEDDGEDYILYDADSLRAEYQ